MMVRFITLIAVFILAAPVMAQVQEHEGDYLYKVASVRAAPGAFSDLLDWHAEIKASGYYTDAGLSAAPLIMRHSQGDQWDLLILTPMESWETYYSSEAAQIRLGAKEKHGALINGDRDMLAFSEDVFATGPDIDVLVSEYADNSLYHIEMFHAAAGKQTELYHQRQMENDYLAATGQTQNMIFTVLAGGDVDVFTIGFHETLQSFAAPSGATNEESETAAVEAGFKDRADLSFYLRSLITAHHDTLAGRVD